MERKPVESSWTPYTSCSAEDIIEYYKAFYLYNTLKICKYVSKVTGFVSKTEFMTKVSAVTPSADSDITKHGSLLNIVLWFLCWIISPFRLFLEPCQCHEAARQPAGTPGSCLAPNPLLKFTLVWDWTTLVGHSAISCGHTRHCIRYDIFMVFLGTTTENDNADLRKETRNRVGTRWFL